MLQEQERNQGVSGSYLFPPLWYLWGHVWSAVPGFRPRCGGARSWRAPGVAACRSAVAWGGVWRARLLRVENRESVGALIAAF